MCAKCGKPMRLQTARRGRNAGSRFWGCSEFPSCRETAAYRSDPTDLTDPSDQTDPSDPRGTYEGNI
ncbi:MAG: topoisomerase DNA-binding C4 zinc finger domain-containing protein [Kiritimatiellae bacterium]|nr:topoisomerase DNA-binding C4 zinc finger domain-containing protein [Kiritimatiellia bacterium]